jgi:hypothetical protein
MNDVDWPSVERALIFARSREPTSIDRKLFDAALRDDPKRFRALRMAARDGRLPSGWDDLVVDWDADGSLDAKVTRQH